MYTNSFSKCGHSHVTNIYVSSPNMALDIKVSVMEYMYNCEHMYVCKEVLSASTRKGTNICEFAQHGFTYKIIVYLM